jgi:hypothetical protein
VYVSVQVLVGCLTSCVGGELSLVNEPEEGCGEYRDIDGAGDGLREVDSIAPAMLGFGDGRLPLLEGVRSWTGRGEMGMFQITASSGSSSSSSSHSASLSLRVFRFESCHDCLLEFSPGDGNSIFRELFRDNVRDCVGNFCAFEGEGDRDDLFGADRPMVVSVGAEGDVKPLLICFPGAASWVCCLCTALLTCPFRVGYFGFAVLVRSRAEWWAECGYGCERFRPPDVKGREDSYMTRLEGLSGIGKVEGPPVASSRLISSKCERLLRSPGPMKSEWVDE